MKKSHPPKKETSGEEKHPKMNEALHRLGDGIKAVHQHHVQQHEKNVARDEEIREQVREQHKQQHQPSPFVPTKSEQQRQHEILAEQQDQYLKQARTFKSFGLYDQAIQQLNTALTISQIDSASSQRLSAFSALLIAFAGINIDINNPKTAELYCELADCYMCKKDYLKAYEYLKPLDSPFTNCPALVKGAINACRTTIIAQVNAKIAEAKAAIAQKNFGAAREHLKIAMPLATALNSRELLDTLRSISQQINQQESKLAAAADWSVHQPAFRALYSRLIIIDLEESIDFDQHLKDVDTCLELFDRHGKGVASKEEHECRMKLAKQKDDMKAMFQRQKDEFEWNRTRAEINNKYMQLFGLAVECEDSDIDTVITGLNVCQAAYQKYAIFLNKVERANDEQITIDLLTLGSRKNEIERAAEERRQREIALSNEQKIKALLQEIEDKLRNGELQAALDKLKKARDILVKETKHPEFMLDQRLANRSSFAHDVKKLEAAVNEYEQRKATQPLEIANQIIADVLAKRTAKDVILDRHKKRIVDDTIVKALTDNWVNFDSRDNSVLFASIVQLINQHLIPIPTSTWMAAGGGATLSLDHEQNRSKEIPKQVGRWIAQHKATEAAPYVELPLIMAMYPLVSNTLNDDVPMAVAIGNSGTTPMWDGVTSMPNTQFASQEQTLDQTQQKAATYELPL